MPTLLVIDDEKVIRDGCSRLFSSEGYTVLTAADGQEGLDVLAREEVDVILCDLQMPVKGVFEVLAEATVRHSDVPLIVITGHATVSNAVDCMKQGAYDFVTKPFRAEHVILVVKRAVEKRNLERRARELQEERERNLHDLAMEQSRLRTIINCMADGVLVTNRELEVVLHNPALTRLLGIQPSSPPPAPLSEYLTDEFVVEGLQTLLDDADESPGLISQDFTRETTHLRALSATVFGPEDQAMGSVTVFHDITELKRLDEMKSNFVNMVSHELRSPMAVIKQQMTVILEGLAGELTPKQRELLSRSRDKTQNLLDLINDLLDVARIESGRGNQQHSAVDLGKMLAEMVAFMESKAESQGVQLELRAEPGLPLVQADARGMEEVFGNLISNAINYSPDGGAVTVTVARQGDSLEVIVRDSGVGIDPEEVPKIFDKFYRVKHPRTRQVIGTGLGLAIVKGIIESHRGSVEVQSRPGVGSAFRVLLPAA